MKKTKKKLTDGNIDIITDLKESVISLDTREIKNVAILSKQSLTASGSIRRRYSDAALASAVSVFEGAPAYLNHQTGSKEKDPRQLQEMFGYYRNVRVTGDKVLGDLHVAPGPEGDKVLFIAENNPGMAGNSIHATGRWRRENGVEVIEEIFPRTKWGRRSTVDLVDDPATTKSLFEEKEEDRKTMDLSTMNLMEFRSARPDLMTAAIHEGATTRDDEVQAIIAERDKAIAESKELKAKVDAYEVKEAIAAKRVAVEKILSESKLPEEAKTEVFVSQLMELRERKEGSDTVTVEKQAMALVEDRLAMVSQKGVIGMGGGKKSLVESKTGEISDDDFANIVAGGN